MACKAELNQNLISTINLNETIQGQKKSTLISAMYKTIHSLQLIQLEQTLIDLPNRILERDELTPFDTK